MCKCEAMAEKLFGDGCDECNPEIAWRKSDESVTR